MTDYHSLSQEQAQSLFSRCIHGRDADALRALLEARPDIDLNATVDHSGLPAPAVVMLAKSSHGSEMLKLILEKGADPEGADVMQVPAIIHASREAEPENMRLLMQAGADVLQTLPHDMNAFSEAGLWMDNTADVLTLLLNAGFEADTPLNGGGSILFVVNRDASADALQVALEAGADPLATDEKGETPVLIAKFEEENATWEMLESYACMPRMKAGKSYSAEELIRSRNNEQRLADNPYNWARHMEACFDALEQQGKPLPDRAALLAEGAEGKSAAQVACEARRGDLVLRALKSHGEKLELADLYDAPHQPSRLMKSLCRTGQGKHLFEEDHLPDYPRSLLKDVHARLPVEVQVNVPLFAQLLQKDQMDNQRTMGGR